MVNPYTNAPADALAVAHDSLGAVLTALVWWRPMRPWPSSVALVVAIWICALSPILPDLWVGLGGTPELFTSLSALNAAAGLGFVAAALTRSWKMGALAAAGWFALAWVGRHVTQSDAELGALHLMWIAIVWAAHARTSWPHSRPRGATTLSHRHTKEDLALFTIGVVLACIVGTLILERTFDSSDEIAYAFDAQLFSHFKAYAPTMPCWQAHRNFWIVTQDGRLFAQYTPGWSLAMAPFARFGVSWLAAPFAFGALVVGVARIARRAGGNAAGRIAAFSILLGVAPLLNAGSRYCHVFITAAFAWTIEAFYELREPASGTRAQWAWGFVLGNAAGLAASTRPQDAFLLGSGVLLCLVHAVFKRRIRWRAIIGMTIPVLFWGALTLVILRLQIGRWFQTGYEVAARLHGDWARVKLSMPGPDQWKMGIPLSEMAYCYWPCSTALGAAGIVLARGRLSLMLALSAIGTFAFYSMLEFGRFGQFGYGPRYHFGLVVPMAVGAGIVLAPLWTALSARLRGVAAVTADAPAVLAFAAIIVGVLRLVPIMYPFAHNLLHLRSALWRAIDEAHLQHAVVVAPADRLGLPAWFAPQNDPTDPNPNVIVVSEAEPQCVRDLYRDRSFYLATGVSEVKITPYP